MPEDPENDLDSHLDRLMETAYEALQERPVHATTTVELPAAIGPFEVRSLLGRGGTSVVFRAHDPALGRDVAIKVVDERLAPGGSLAQRFLDEARVCSQLPHPGIVPIHTVGRLADGRPWFAMQLVEGETLAALLTERSDPSDRLPWFLEVFARVCDTVAFAHGRRVVHGDLKPGNVMVGQHGRVQVLDWGFSRSVESDGGEAAPFRPMGTPAFIAPEQGGPGSRIDARTDVFGLGAVLCVILTGAPPFVGGSRSEVEVRAAQGLLGDALARLRSCGADRELVQLAIECLQQDPAARPTDASSVAQRVSAWFLSVEERARRSELAAAEAAVEANAQRRVKRATIAVVAIVVLFAVVYAWMAFERQAHDFETRASVVQALERAQNLRSGADIAGPERTRWLSEAAVAAQNAKDFAVTLGEPELLRAAEELSARLDRDRDAAVRDDAMGRWLDEFPAHLDLSRDALDDHLRAGFASFGVDVETSSADDAARQLRASSIAAALAGALDDWGFVRHARPEVPPAEWRRFHDIALHVDGDALRGRIRRALVAEDPRALVSLLDDPEFDEASGETLDLLGNALARAGHRDAAISVWRRANARHPHNVRVLHSLGVQLLNDSKCPPWDEAVRLFSTGTAVRPDNAHLWCDLAFALAGRGNRDAAEEALVRVLALDPRSERAVASFLELLHAQGELERAVARLREHAERHPEVPSIRRRIGDALLADGRLTDAVAEFRRAAADHPDGANHERLGRGLLELGEIDEAIVALRTACRHEPERPGANASLGLALRLRGEFDEALDCLRRARTADPETARRCDSWIAEIERAMQREEETVDRGAGAAELIEHALLAWVQGRAIDAATLYRTAFAAEPDATDAVFFGRSLDIALLAAAAVARDVDGTVPAAQRSAWRDIAIDWLRADIDGARRKLRTGELAPATARRKLAAWRDGRSLRELIGHVATDLAAMEAAIGVGATPRVHDPFTTAYEFVTLGRPTGVPMPFGGVAFDRLDPDTLLVAGHAQRLTSGMYAVRLVRDDNGHAIGFGNARHVAATPFADGGLAHGPRATLLYTRYPHAELGVLEQRSRTPDQVLRLEGASSGGLAIVPPGFPGTGRVKRLTWPGGQWFDGELAGSGGELEISGQRHVSTLSGGPDGFAFVAGNPPWFSAPSVLVAEWSAHGLVAYELDPRGDPLVDTRRVVVSGFRGVLGVALDERTGDVLLSTWRGDGTEELAVLRRKGA